MTRELCHALFRHWENDPDIYDDLSLFKAFQYDPAWVDRYFDAKRRPGRVLLAVMLEGRPIGEVQLKQIDREKNTCVLSRRTSLVSAQTRSRWKGTEKR